MENLPSEILIEIFEHLHQPDLLSATLVCHRFNALISTSPRLLSKLTVVLNGHKCCSQWIGSRRYSNFSVFREVLGFFDQNLGSLLDGVTSLSIFCTRGQFQPSWPLPPAIFHLHTILANARSLKTLLVTLHEEPSAQERVALAEAKIQPKFTLDLDSFVFCGRSEYLPLFYGLQTRTCKLSCSGSSRGLSEFRLRATDNVVEFLARQKGLRRLSLAAYNLEQMFLAKELPTIGFGLTRLEFSPRAIKNVDAFAKFLQIQGATLAEVVVNCVEEWVLKILQNFPKLRTLKFAGHTPMDAVLACKFPALQRLAIHAFRPEIADVFPNLRDLELWSVSRKIRGLERFARLETLMVEGCTAELAVPSRVRRFEYRSEDRFESSRRPFSFEGEALEELRIRVRTTTPKWLKELKDERTKIFVVVVL